MCRFRNLYFWKLSFESFKTDEIYETYNIFIDFSIKGDLKMFHLYSSLTISVNIQSNFLESRQIPLNYIKSY